MTNHHFTGVFSITERRYDRRLFSQETNKNKKKKETGVRGMWRRTYAQLKNFSFYLLPVSPLFGKKMKRLGLHFISLYFHNNTTVCVCVICFCLVRVLLSPAFRVEKWSHLILGPVYYPPSNWLHVVYIIYFASPLEISTYCLPFRSSLTKSVCTIPVFV